VITVTGQKTKEIGVIKALGATPGKILSGVPATRVVVGVIGVMTDGAGRIDRPLINPINHFLSRVVGIELFPREIYNFAAIPTFLTTGDLFTIWRIGAADLHGGGIVAARCGRRGSNPWRRYGMNEVGAWGFSCASVKRRESSVSAAGASQKRLYNDECYEWNSHYSCCTRVEQDLHARQASGWRCCAGSICRCAGAKRW